MIGLKNTNHPTISLNCLSFSVVFSIKYSERFVFPLFDTAVEFENIVKNPKILIVREI